MSKSQFKRSLLAPQNVYKSLWFSCQGKLVVMPSWHILIIKCLKSPIGVAKALYEFKAFTTDLPKLFRSNFYMSLLQWICAVSWIYPTFLHLNTKLFHHPQTPDRMQLASACVIYVRWIFASASKDNHLKIWIGIITIIKIAKAVII